MPDPWALLMVPTVALFFLWAVVELGVAYLARATRASDGSSFDD